MIKTEKLSKTYLNQGRRLDVLKDIDLMIPDSSFFSIVGKSGSGKSTLLSLLAGLDTPTSGSIEAEGIRIHELTEEELVNARRKIFGFIFQSYHLIPSLTALENVLVPAQLAGIEHAEARAGELLSAVGLGDRLSHNPRQMSGGEQQRVAVCRALVHDPKIIFADEPTGNLDSANGEKILELLVSLRKSKTLVLVTHDEQIAARADHRIRMADGRIIESV